METKFYYIFAMVAVICLAGYEGYKRYLDNQLAMAKVQHSCPTLEGSVQLEFDVNGQKQTATVPLVQK